MIKYYLLLEYNFYSLFYGAVALKCDIHKIQLNHYYTKSREELIKKVNRGFADHPTKKHILK